MDVAVVSVLLLFCVDYIVRVVVGSVALFMMVFGLRLIVLVGYVFHFYCFVCVAYCVVDWLCWCCVF